MILAIVLRTDGTRHEQTFDGDAPPLQWLQEQVDGYIEVLPGQTRVICVNEDGLARRLPVNELAMAELGMVPGSVDGAVRGNVVIIESAH